MTALLEARAAAMRSRYARGRHKASIVQALLESGPVTAFELSVISGRPLRNCSAWLSEFCGIGIAESVGRRRIGRRKSTVYALKDGLR